jgi:chromosome transmission fidelity protein 1
MAYWDAQPSGLTGQQLYEAMCMNAVNQCVGRVIRHAGDFAAIVLVDARYLGASGAGTGAGRGGGGTPVRKLPKWLQQSLESEHVQGFGFVYSRLVTFFKRHASVGGKVRANGVTPAQPV